MSRRQPPSPQRRWPAAPSTRAGAAGRARLCRQTPAGAPARPAGACQLPALSRCQAGPGPCRAAMGPGMAPLHTTDAVPSSRSRPSPFCPGGVSPAKCLPHDPPRLDQPRRNCPRRHAQGQPRLGKLSPLATSNRTSRCPWDRRVSAPASSGRAACAATRSITCPSRASDAGSTPSRGRTGSHPA